MSVLILDPHGDDCALFCAYTAMRYVPVIVVLHQTVPTAEIERAAKQFGCGVAFKIPSGEWLKVYAPAWHEGGHSEHNEVSHLATAAYGNKVTYYETYAPRGQRTRTDNEVPYEPWMVARKLRALSCFVSQIEQESTRPWFTSLLDLREWVA